MGLYSTTNELHLMPIMVLACAMCPKGIEATFYALVLAIINAGYLISYWLGGLIAYGLGVTGEVGSFGNLPVLVGIAAGVPLISLVCLFWLPKENQVGLASVIEEGQKRATCDDESGKVRRDSLVPTNMRDSFEG